MIRKNAFLAKIESWKLKSNNPPAKVIEEGQKRIVKYLRYCKRHIQDYRSRIALLVNVILEHCNVVIDGDDDDNLSLISLGNLTISA